MKKLFIFFIIIFTVLILATYFFIVNQDEEGMTNLNENLDGDKEIIKEEYNEEYINFIRDKNDYPILLQNLEEVESKIFIEKLGEVKLNPRNILKVANEIYFVSEVNKEGQGDGQALFIYDVVMRKFGELYFYKKDENNEDTLLTLVAIDVVGNKLILALRGGDLDCSSLWLGQSDNFYSFDLLDNGKDGLLKYEIPAWKIDEEKMKYSDCDMQSL